MFGFEINENSISVPAYALYVISVGVSMIFMRLILGDLVFRLREKKQLKLQEKRKLQEALRQDNAKARKEEEVEAKISLKKLFPYPWLHAYEACSACDMRITWLRSWLKHSDPVKQLPKLSTKAIEKFAYNILPNTWDDEYKEAISILAPYIEYSYDLETPENRIHMMAARKTKERECKHMPSSLERHIALDDGVCNEQSTYVDKKLSMECGTISADKFCDRLDAMVNDMDISNIQFRKFVIVNLPNVVANRVG